MGVQQSERAAPKDEGWVYTLEREDECWVCRLEQGACGQDNKPFPQSWVCLREDAPTSSSSRSDRGVQGDGECDHNSFDATKKKFRHVRRREWLSLNMKTPPYPLWIFFHFFMIFCLCFVSELMVANKLKRFQFYEKFLKF